MRRSGSYRPGRIGRRGLAAMVPVAMAAAALSTLVAGCGGIQSALDPAGPQAARIDALWWFMFVICSAVFVLVILFTIPPALRATRRRREPIGAPDLSPDPAGERRRTGIVVVAVALTTVILFTFLVKDFLTGRALASIERPGALTLNVVGHQWWWEITYEDSVQSRSVVTANEIHVPVGRTILVKGTSHDVIHSFWAPNLHGKKDLIPGYLNTMWFRVDKPGIYRGQCAEFCGYQHARMAFLIIAEPVEKFQAWLDRQRAETSTPTDSLLLRGRNVFLSSPCVMCHSIQGTPAAAKTAPDLTHIGSRMTIAAGTLRNTRGNLAGWIVDPQGIKPGSYMPGNDLDPADLQALVAYLESLK